MISDCWFKSFLPGTFFPPSFPSVLFFPLLWYIFFFLKMNSILLCWWAIKSFDFRAFTDTLFYSAASFNLMLTDWVLLDCFPSSTWHLFISFSFQVTFHIFSVAALPRCQTFLGLHSYFSLISCGIPQGTLTFSPIPNLSQILKPHSIGVIDDTVMTQLCDFPETLGR